MTGSWFARFLVTLTLAVAQTSVAQPARKMLKVGWIAFSEPTTPDVRAIYDAFFRGLRENGFVDGQNVVVERKYMGRQQGQVARVAAEFAGKKVDVIVTTGAAAARAAKEATQTIPIVFTGVTYPDQLGLVTNLARPEGNVTGLANIFSDGGGRFFQSIKEAAPERSRVAILFDPRSGGSAAMLKLQISAAREQGLTPIPVEVKNAAELERGLERVLRERAGALCTHPVMEPYGKRIAEFATKYRLPIIDMGGLFIKYGALFSTTIDWQYMAHRAGVYVARILKGAHPHDLPVEQPTKLNFVVNLKTAKTLGIKIPPSVLLQADRVIE